MFQVPETILQAKIKCLLHSCPPRLGALQSKRTAFSAKMAPQFEEGKEQNFSDFTATTPDEKATAPFSLHWPSAPPRPPFSAECQVSPGPSCFIPFF